MRKVALPKYYYLSKDTQVIIFHYYKLIRQEMQINDKIITRIQIQVSRGKINVNGKRF